MEFVSNLGSVFPVDSLDPVESLLTILEPAIDQAIVPHVLDGQRAVTARELVREPVCDPLAVAPSFCVKRRLFFFLLCHNYSLVVNSLQSRVDSAPFGEF
jgi:hypothetical protein